MNLCNFKHFFIEIIKSQKVQARTILNDLYEVPEPPRSEKEAGEAGGADLSADMIFDAFLSTASIELKTVTNDIQAMYLYVVDGMGCDSEKAEEKRSTSPLLGVLIDFIDKITLNNRMLASIYAFLYGHRPDKGDDRDPKMSSEVEDINEACSAILEGLKLGEEILSAISDIVCSDESANVKVSIAPASLDSVCNPTLPCTSDTCSNRGRNGTYRNY